MLGLNSDDGVHIKALAGILKILSKKCDDEDDGRL